MFLHVDLQTDRIIAIGSKPSDEGCGALRIYAVEMPDNSVLGSNTHYNFETKTLECRRSTTEWLEIVRNSRKHLLTACDWTQTLDAPLTAEKKAEWAVYRQALRDFPDVCDPVAPVWPVAPI